MISAHHPLGDSGELAALYAAGAMAQEQVAVFEAHLAEGCPACAAELRAVGGTIEFLSSGIKGATPPARARDALLNRIRGAAQSASPTHETGPQVWRRWSADAHDEGLFIKRAAEGSWEETGVAGVRVRRLFVDQRRNEMMMLVRMDPGASYPRHIHDGPEQCLVLEGELHVGDAVLRTGDYQRAAPHSLHGVQSTEAGCLLLITSSLTDELV